MQSSRFRFKDTVLYSQPNTDPEQRETQMAISEKSTGSELAALLGITARRVSQLATQGIFKKVGKDAYMTAASIQAFIAHREVVLSKQYGQGDFGKARVAVYQERALRMKLDREKVEGTLMLRSETIDSWSKIAVLIRDNFMALPTRVAPQLVNIKTPMAAQAILQPYVIEILENLRNTEIHVIDPEDKAA
jgi:phage terminase Nu1 subunit (DNA packaging protein)